MESIHDQIPRIPQTEKDEIEEGSKGDHSININQICAKKFKDLGNSPIKSRTMFKVNVWLHESNPDAYTPKMVSIGPYHNKNPQLRRMEKYKWLYLERFLERKGGLDAESCIKELEGLKNEALKCYDDVETDEFWQPLKCYDDVKTDGFCLMLLLDGCFVVEFIQECCGMCPEGEDKIMNSDIFIKRDLILLENQLPFFVLAKLHDMTKRDDELELQILASIIWVPFFVKFPESTIGTLQQITSIGIKHLLHLKHEILCHGMKKRQDDLQGPMVTSNATGLSEPLIEAGGCYGKDNDDQTWHMVMPNATELSEAGVSFVKVSSKTSIFDSIKFENGLMKLPRFRVADDTETLLRNLIAYEQQSVDVQPKHFSNFAIFMDKLIESDKDVNLLCHKGIIENWLGDDKEVANLFNKIGNGVFITGHDFYYYEECRKAVKHCKKSWNKRKAQLVRYYFSTPLVAHTIVVALTGLTLTLIQTILAFIDSVNK